MIAQCRFGTSTATLAVFDPACLEHRLDDVADWWSDPTDEVAEINAGNVLFVSTGSDGTYEVSIFGTEQPVLANTVHAKLRCVSGHVLVGAGEQVPSEGVRPSTQYGGTLLTLAPGAYSVTVAHPVAGQLVVSIVATHADAKNAFSDSPSLDWPTAPKAPPTDLAPQTVVVGTDQWARCPNCGVRFKTTDQSVFSEGKHQRCGQPLLLKP
jgi:Family of unknown function (DUF6386)